MKNVIIKNKIDEYIGRQLRLKRKKRGYTLLDVASEIGLSYQQIQKYEQAHSKVSAAILYKFAQLYSISIDNFFANLSVSLCNFSAKNNASHDKKNKEVNILIVEDNPEDEAMIRRALSVFENMNILCVHDGNQTMEVLKYKTLCAEFPIPDLIFLNAVVTRKDGLIILKDIKRNINIQNIPIVMIASNVNPELMTKAYQNGASGYICKPFDFQTFQENISDCIRYWTKTVVLPSSAQYES